MNENSAIAMSGWRLKNHLEVVTMLVPFSQFLRERGDSILIALLQKRLEKVRIYETLLKQVNYDELGAYDFLEIILKAQEQCNQLFCFDVHNNFLAMEVCSSVEDLGLFPLEGEDDNHTVAVFLAQAQNYQELENKNYDKQCVFTYNFEEKNIQDVYYFEFKDEMLEHQKTFVIE